MPTPERCSSHNSRRVLSGLKSLLRELDHGKSSPLSLFHCSKGCRFFTLIRLFSSCRLAQCATKSQNVTTRRWRRVPPPRCHPYNRMGTVEHAASHVPPSPILISPNVLAVACDATAAADMCYRSFAASGLPSCTTDLAATALCCFALSLSSGF